MVTWPLKMHSTGFCMGLYFSTRLQQTPIDNQSLYSTTALIFWTKDGATQLGEGSYEKGAATHKMSNWRSMSSLDLPIT